MESQGPEGSGQNLCTLPSSRRRCKGKHDLNTRTHIGVHMCAQKHLVHMWHDDGLTLMFPYTHLYYYFFSLPSSFPSSPPLSFPPSICVFLSSVLEIEPRVIGSEGQVCSRGVGLGVERSWNTVPRGLCSRLGPSTPFSLGQSSASWRKSWVHPKCMWLPLCVVGLLGAVKILLKLLPSISQFYL